MIEKDDVIGDYTLVKFLGKGQFGEVWLAEKQIQFSTRKFRHALKFLSNRDQEINLKAAEAEIDTWIEASGHPNVMSVLDMLTHKEHIIITSEYAEGGSLNGWLKKSGGKAPSYDKALEMMSGILRGIEYLHSKKVVHRDLKPDNILLQSDLPRITDFGISRIVAEGTLSTKPIGSPAYMSPEAFMGNKSPQTDIWSAGVILYEMLTGRFPYEHEMIYGLIHSIQEDEPRPLPDHIPKEIRAIVETALQKDREKRFQTAREMRAAVDRARYALSSDSEIQASTIGIDESKISIPTDEILRKTDGQRLVETGKPENQTQSEKSNDQPDVEKLKMTEASGIEATQDVSILERKKQEEQQKELEKIVSDTEKNKHQWQTEKKRKNFLAIGIGGVLGLLILGLIGFWLLRDKPAESANTPNSNANAQTGSAKITPPAGMVYVAGGEFTMGRDEGKNEVEEPAHKAIVNPFFIDTYEVTNEKYAEFVKATNHAAPANWTNGTYPTGQAQYPVVGVMWDDANAYAKWADKRLPTEEEWEFAARGTGNSLYPWGNDWKQGNANANGAGKDFAEVGKYKGTSALGVYDMIGNAWEWTASDFEAYPNGKLPDAFAGKTNLKTIRGGSFEASKDYATATYRIGWAASGAENYDRTGFRCVKDVEK